MNQFFKHMGKREYIFLFILFCILFFGYQLRGFNEPDEGRYASMGLNLLDPGVDLLEPILSGYGHYDKPPLIYWLTALVFKVFGKSEAAGRLTSLLAALSALFGLGWAAWRLYGQRVAYLSILICATLGQFWLLSRYLIPDIFLTSFICLAIGAWAEARHKNDHIGWWMLSALFWILGWWAKATVVFIPLGGLILGCWLGKDWSGLKTLRPLRLSAVILLLGCPWYVWMIHKHPDLINFFLHREFVGRMTGHVDGRRGPLYYHLLVILIGWLPWWPIFLWKIFTHRRVTLHKKIWTQYLFTPEGIMVLLGIVIFSMISSKLPHYTLILAPWAALLMARYFVEQCSEVKNMFVEKAVLGFAIFTCLASIIIPQYESRLALNSSMREVAQELKKSGAEEVWMDRYWPGMEFYFGKRVIYFTDKVPTELPDETGFCKELGRSHFVSPEKMESLSKERKVVNVWLVHYRKQKLKNRALQAVKVVGDFELIPLH